jgi:TonB-linked SusC/RagA family outer membrane protein
MITAFPAGIWACLNQQVVADKLFNQPKQRECMQIVTTSPPPGRNPTKTKGMWKPVLFTLFFGCLAGAANAQEVTYTAKNAAIEKVFTAVEQQTGYVFFYDETILKDAKPVTIKAERMRMLKFLDTILQDQPLRYSLHNKTVTIFTKPVPGRIDNGRQTGRVFNENGEAIAGASVKVKGNNITTVTSTHGIFVLPVSQDPRTIVVSGVNIETTEFHSKAPVAPITIIVKTKITAIDEVQVVSTGYQQITRERITGSVVKIDKEIINRTTGLNIIDRLDGVTPGLLFDKRNPNKLRLQVRGLYTLNTNDRLNPLNDRSNPLIIVDNFPFEGNLDALNPNDVEDITILRDAAATSIWGARAGNGVIVITTKKGRPNQQVSVSSMVTINERPDLFDIPLIPTSETIDLTRFLFDKGKYNSDITNVRRPALPKVVEILARQRNGEITAAEADAQINALRGIDIRNDMLEYFYRPMVRQSHTVGFNSGSRIASLYLSAGYDKELSERVGDQFDRISFRAHNNFQPVKNMLLQLGLNYSAYRDETNSLGWGASELRLNNSQSPPMYTKLADENGNALVFDRVARESYLDTLGRGRLLNWKYRPLDEVRNRDWTNRSQNLLATLGVRYTVSQAITAEVNGKFERTNTTQTRHNNLATWYTRDLINQYTNLNTTDPYLRNPVPIGGILDVNEITLDAYNLRGQVNVNQRWGNDHQLAALAGGEIGQRSYQSHADRTYAYNDRLNNALVDYVTRYPKFLGSSGTVPDATSAFSFFNETLNRFASAFANASYTYKGRYTISASARKDASNVFGAAINRRGRPFWSAGAAWKISNESFYHIPWLPLLKARLTYGYNGNYDASGTAVTTIFFVPASSNPLTGLPYSLIRTIPNPNLRWEKVGQWNAAIDFQTKNERIGGSLEYYVKRSVDVVTASFIDPTSGVLSLGQALLINSAEIKGSGIDLQIVTRNIDNPAFQWTSNISLSSARYRVTKKISSDIPTASNTISEGTDAPSDAFTGYNPYEVISYGWGGLDPQTGFPRGLIDGKPFLSKDSVSKIKLTDLVFHGPNVPEYYGNLLNTFSWKGIMLSANITYRFRYYFRRPGINYSRMVADNGVGHPDYFKRWQKPGDEAFTDVPAFVYPLAGNYNESMYTRSAVLVEKGDHIRWEDLRLAYSLRPTGKSMAWLKQVTLSAIVTNLNILLWKANDEGIDPEFPNGLKNPRSIAFGINANF